MLTVRQTPVNLVWWDVSCVRALQSVRCVRAATLCSIAYVRQPVHSDIFQTANHSSAKVAPLTVLAATKLKSVCPATPLLILDI